MTKSLQILLDQIIDYAGLFPPAQLDMRSAVRNYATYRHGPWRWLLGRFVLPCARLAEFERAHDNLEATTFDPWRLSVLAGTDQRTDLDLIRAFNERNAASQQALIDTIELKAADPAMIHHALDQIDGRFDAYVELPIMSDPQPLIAVLAERGGRAKVRTGGVTPETIPSAADLLRFIAACVAADVPFKATAGLHHPLRAIQRLSYAPDSPSAPLFGFLNVFLTTAALRAGWPIERAKQVLIEADHKAVSFCDDGVIWRRHLLDNAVLAEMRRSGAIAVGSCSFEEPIADMQAIGVL